MIDPLASLSINRHISSLKQSVDSEKRIDLVEELSRRGDNKVINYLVKLVATESSADVRSAATYSLSRFKGKRVEQALVRACSDKKMVVSWYARRILAKIRQ